MLCLMLHSLNVSLHTAGIISLLAHIFISVALNIVVHPQLTYEHQSPYH